MSEGRTEEIYKWSANQTTESHEFDLKDYYWTRPIITALFRLKNTERALIGIQGLQGTGKSAALEALLKSFPEDTWVFKWKWKREWEEAFLNDEIPTWDEYWLALWNRLVLVSPEIIQNKIKTSPDTIKHELHVFKTASDKPKEFGEDVKFENVEDFAKKSMSPKEQARERLNEYADVGVLEHLLGADAVKEVKRNIFENFLNQVSCIFIDMPDYNKTNLQLMSKDVDELQHIWNEFMEKGRKTSFLITVQKEIVMKKPHFFFGKIRWLDLEPLTPNQLLEAYLQKWRSFEPFTEDSLKFIAKLSRGVFRRFLNYINITIEQFKMASKSGLISVEDVEKAVSLDILIKDLELELSDIFPNSQQRVQTVKVLDMLRKVANLTQKEIAENLGISEATAGKLVARLQLYNYVERIRSREGKGWLVSLL